MIPARTSAASLFVAITVGPDGAARLRHGKVPPEAQRAIPRILELDFLRLVRAVEHFRASGDEAIGYIAVLTDAIQKRIRHWIKKYVAGDCVRVVVAPVLDADPLRFLRCAPIAYRRSRFH